MTKVLVLYYSAWGHMEQMAYAAAEGAKAGGAQVDVKRVPELVPDAVAKASYYKMDQKAAVAQPDELADYDAIIFAAGTRFGSFPAQMRNFRASMWRKSLRNWQRSKSIGLVDIVGRQAFALPPDAAVPIRAEGGVF